MSWHKTVHDVMALCPTAIAKIRIAEISRALTELKLQEVASREDPSGQGRVKTILAQSAELEREILRLAIWALEDEDRRLSSRYLDAHPKRRALKAEIAARRNDLGKQD